MIRFSVFVIFLFSIPALKAQVFTGGIRHSTSGAYMDGANGVAVSGNFAFVISEVSNALEVIDISNRSNPRHVAVLKDEDEVTFSDGSTGIFELENPSTIWISGNYAYIGSSGWQELLIVDVTNPAHPAPFVRSAQGSTHVSKIQVVGNYAFLGKDKGNSITILNISNPDVVATVKILTTADTPIQDLTSFFISGNFLYAGCSNGTDGRLLRFDITNPELPVFNGQLNHGNDVILSSIKDIFVQNNTAYVLNSGALEVVNVGNKLNPLHLYAAVLTNITGAKKLCKINEVIYIAYSTGMVALAGNQWTEKNRVETVSPPFQTIGNPEGMVAAGNLLYVACRDIDALEIFDVSPPDSPEIRRHPTNKLVCLNGLTAFTAAATAGTYRWEYSRDNISFTPLSDGFIPRNTTRFAGTATAQLQVSQISISVNNWYFRARIHHGYQTIYTNSARLSVNVIPVVVTNPQPLNVCAPLSGAMTVSFSGINNAYRWYYVAEGGDISTAVPQPFGSAAEGSRTTGEASSTITFEATSITQAGNERLYFCKAANQCGGGVSGSARLVVQSPPVITKGMEHDFVQCTANGNALMLMVSSSGGPLNKFSISLSNDGQNFDSPSEFPGPESSYTLITSGSSDSYIRLLVRNVCGASPSLTKRILRNNSAPIIATPLTPLTSCAGGEGQFQVRDVTEARFYKWQFSTDQIAFSDLPDGSLSGQQTLYSNTITATLNLTKISPQINGNFFRVKVTNACGTIFSNAVKLTVSGSAPVISQQPVDQYVCINQVNGIFSVIAHKADSYRWQYSPVNADNWIDCSANSIFNGSHSANLMVTAQASTPIKVRCLLDNGCQTTSNSAQLIISQTAPAILTPPVNQVICAGQSVTFSATAASGSLCQWMLGDDPAIVSLGNIFLIKNVPASLSGATIHFTASNGCKVSTDANLTVNSPIDFAVVSPVSICEGSTLTLNPTVSGGGPYIYRWKKDNVEVGTEAGFTRSHVSISDEGNYTVVVSNACAAQISPAVSVQINTAVEFINLPQNRVVCESGAASFGVTTVGRVTGYQWQYQTAVGSTWQNVTSQDFPNSTGIFSAVLSLAAIQSAWNGYKFRCQISGACGTPGTGNNYAVLTVNSSVTGTASGTINACKNSDKVLSVTDISGGGPFDFSWIKEETVLANVTASTDNFSTWALNNIQPSQAGNYRLKVKNACGERIFGQFVSVSEPSPAVLISASQTVCAGMGFVLTATSAPQGGPFTFQWKKEGNDYTGIVHTSNNMSSLNFNAITASDAGSYSVVVQNACGSYTGNSSVISINNCSTPLIPAGGQPRSLTVCNNGNASFTVTAVNGSTYLWMYSNGNIIHPIARHSTTFSGMDQATLTMNNIDARASGSTFKCRVTGANGSHIESSTATLLVTSQAATIDTPPPALKSVCFGNKLSLPVTLAAGGTPATYIWKKQNVEVRRVENSTLTNDIYTEDNLTADASYTIEVSNGCQGAVAASASTLVTVSNAIPSVTVQPATLSLCVGGVGGSLTTNSNMGDDATYDWYKNHQGAYNTFVGSGKIFPFQTPSLAANGSYRCTISNGCGSVNSAPAPVYVSSGDPNITQPPVDIQSCAGLPASIGMTAENTNIYQWQQRISAAGDWTNLQDQVGFATGANMDTYSFNYVENSADGYQYRCHIANGCHGFYSNTVTMNVKTNSPVITNHPLDVFQCSGGVANFAVVADGNLYQWESKAPDGEWQILSDQGHISGALTSSLTVTTGLPLNGYQYRCKVTGACGYANSHEATLKVNDSPPTIASAPTGTKICAGNDLRLSVTSAGEGPYTYFWYKEGTAIPLSTSAPTSDTKNIFQIPALTQSAAGNYYVEVKNACQTRASSAAHAATVTVVSPPEVLPEAATNQALQLCAGDALSLSLTATGDELKYQWFKDGFALLGERRSTCNKSSITTSDAGIYSVTISGNCGSPLTHTVREVNVRAVTITQKPPAFQTLCAGQPLSLSITATGDALSYKWFKDELEQSGKTSNIFTIQSLTAADAGIYSVQVTNSACQDSQVSTGFEVVIGAGIIEQPVMRQAICPREELILSVEGSGSHLTYKWTKDGTEISGATASTFYKNNITDIDAGRYRAQVISDCGSAESNDAFVVVSTDLQVLVHPSDARVCVSRTASFYALGTKGALYQWQILNGEDYVDLAEEDRIDRTIYKGVNKQTLNIYSPSISVTGTTYRCKIYNTCGTILYTGSAVLTVSFSGLTITQPPLPQTVCPGGNINLSVTANSQGDDTALNYQWLRDGVPVGNNNRVYSVAATSNDQGLYQVIISNSCRSEASELVQVCVGVGIIVPPSGQTICAGGTISLSVTAAGQGALTYQWFKEGNNIAGATSENLTIYPATAADAGSYRVVISGACGEVTSGEAIVNVGVGVKSGAPASLVICTGGSASFHVEATGAGLSYQWQYFSQNSWQNAVNGSLHNATWADVNSPLLKITNAAGAFYNGLLLRCSVTGTCDQANSEVATLTIGNGALGFSQQPQTAQTICEGEEFHLSVTPSGTGPFIYSWKKDGVSINSYESNLRIFKVRYSDAGSYTVDVSDCNGKFITSTAGLLYVSTIGLEVVPEPNIIVCRGGSIRLKVVASGLSPFTYKWTLNNIDLPVTSDTYSNPAVTVQAGGLYEVTVSSVNCPSAKAVTTSRVTVGISIVAQPPEQKLVCEKGVFSISAAATGNNLSYQWKKDNVVLPEQTSPVLIIHNVQNEDAGSYNVSVSSPGCTTLLSQSCNLILRDKLKFTADLSATPVPLCEGAKLSLGVTVTGAPPFLYRWRRDDVIVSEQSHATLTITNTIARDAGKYKVAVFDVCGASIESKITPVNILRSVRRQPVSLLTTCNSHLSLSIRAMDDPAVQFQWKKNGTNIPGAVDSVYFKNNASADDAGVYAVLVKTKSCGETLSSPVSVNVEGGIKTQPSGASICTGEEFSTHVETYSYLGYSFNWLKDNSDIPNQTMDRLRLASVTPLDDGIYSVRIVNDCGTLLSDPAKLTVGPRILTDLEPVSTCAGVKAEFKMQVAGTNPSFEWRKDKMVKNQSGNIYTILSTTSDDAGVYRAIITVCNVIFSSKEVLLTISGRGYFEGGKIAVLHALPVELDFGSAIAFKYSGPTDGVTFGWDFGDGSIIGTDQNPVHYYYLEGTHKVSLTARAGAQCSRHFDLSSPIVVNRKKFNPLTGDMGVGGLSVYPVPVHNELTVESDSELKSLTLCSLQGMVVRSQSCRGNKATISLFDLSVGLYVLVVEDGRGVRRIKVVKE